MKRKTEKDYHELAESRGFKWVGSMLPKNTRVKTLWECKEGHRWETAGYNILRGTGCPYCSMKVRKTEKNYYDLAEKCGFKWVGKVLPKNVHTKTWWECKKDYRWKATYNNIQQGTNCPFCRGKIEKDYYKLAEGRGFKWIGDMLPENTKSKTKWECSIGHKWETTYDSIKSKGSGCPYCGGVVKKVKQDYFKLAKFRCFKWVGKGLPPNTNIKTMWECKKGHVWEATYNKINHGRGCPYCAGLAIKTEKDYHLLAKNRGFKWVGIKLPKYTADKTKWLCDKGHKFKATYTKIQQGRGCTKCSNTVNGLKVSKPQIKLNNLLYGSLNYPENKYRIDVAIMRNSQKIAVEYDAQYWHNGREKQDAERDEFLISCGWKILHVKSGHLLPTQKQLKTTINCLLKTENKIYNLYLEDWK